MYEEASAWVCVHVRIFPHPMIPKSEVKLPVLSTNVSPRLLLFTSARLSTLSASAFDQSEVGLLNECV